MARKLLLRRLAMQLTPSGSFVPPLPRVRRTWHPMPGEVVGGKYRVEGTIGRGGMAIVLRAVHAELGRPVALKILSPQAADDPDTVDRFVREGHATARIASEHAVRIFDVGQLPDGRPYHVMELLDGMDLARLVTERGPLAPVFAVRCIVQACRALAAAHAAGIVHRDIKPSNLFLTVRADGSTSVKVIDFGVSKVRGAALGVDMAAATIGERLVGSPTYMSPEQILASRDVDARADVWALGASLHEMLTGVLAFNATSLPDLFASILESAPAAIDDPRIPTGLRAIIATCLAKDPARRFASVGELARALKTWLVELDRPAAAKLAPAAARPAASTAPAIEVSGVYPSPESVDGSRTARTGPSRRVRNARRALPYAAALVFASSVTWVVLLLLRP